MIYKDKILTPFVSQEEPKEEPKEEGEEKEETKEEGETVE